MKKFIIIGSMNAITYKDIFSYIQQDSLWLGNHYVKEFVKPTGEVQKFGNILWYTNISHKKRNTPLDLYKRYSNEYPKYDNINAIEVSRVENIPMDYDGLMGVPLTFLHKYNPEQFEILGLDRYVEDNPHYGHRFTINGKETYARILIRKRNA